jgi:PKD repeat protein
MWDVLSPSIVPNIPVSLVVPTNQPPTASIAALPSLTWPTNGIQLDGSGSKDADGKVVAYRWTISPAVLVSDPTAVKPFVLFPGPGSYSITLAVTDNAGATTSTKATITVNPIPPIAPQRSVTAVSATINGVIYPLPLSWLTIIY